MTIKYGLKLSQKKVYELLCYFDRSSDVPLSEGLDFNSYSKKLSDFAYFVIAYENKKMLGFLAYYLNTEGKFVYIPQIVVHETGRHMGIGHKMLLVLQQQYCGVFSYIELEVLKDNQNARLFYGREGFVFKEDHIEKILLTKNI